MMRTYFSRMSLLARFTLVSFFITLLIAAGLASQLEVALERDALAAVAENTADQARNILSRNLTAADLAGSLRGQRYEEIEGEELMGKVSVQQVRYQFIPSDIFI